MGGTHEAGDELVDGPGGRVVVGPGEHVAADDARPRRGLPGRPTGPAASTHVFSSGWARSGPGGPGRWSRVARPPRSSSVPRREGLPVVDLQRGCGRPVDGRPARGAGEGPALAARPGGCRPRRRPRRQRLAPRACRTACAPSTSPRTSASREGRNVGAREAGGEFLFFYDDDAVAAHRRRVARLGRGVRADERIAVVAAPGVDPAAGRRRGAGSRACAPGPRCAAVTSASSGRACAHPPAAFEQVGGWPGHFWYGHEGIDLACRLCGRGLAPGYAPDIVVNHPATSPTRHAIFYRMNARNRVWVARRNLPHPVDYLYDVVGRDLRRAHP